MNSTVAQQAAGMPAETVVVSQAISPGTILGDEVTESLTQLRDGEARLHETGLFVQQIGTTEGGN